MNRPPVLGLLPNTNSIHSSNTKYMLTCLESKNLLSRFTIAASFLSLLDAFAEQEFNLAIQRAKIIFSPCDQFFPKRCRQSERYLLFFFFVQ